MSTGAGRKQPHGLKAQALSRALSDGRRQAIRARPPRPGTSPLPALPSTPRSCEPVRHHCERPCRPREDRGRRGFPRPWDLDQQDVRLHRAVRSARTRVPRRPRSAAWIAEIEKMIADHHKITPSHANHDSLVEPFRRADWIDVTRGLRTFGLPGPLIRSVLAGWPSAGFHWRLVQLESRKIPHHPLTPWPMVKL